MDEERNEREKWTSQPSDSFNAMMTMNHFYKQLRWEILSTRQPRIEFIDLEQMAEELEQSGYQRAACYCTNTYALQVIIAPNFDGREEKLLPMSGFSARFRKSDTPFVLDMIDPRLFQGVTFCKLTKRKNGVWKEADLRRFLITFNALFRDDSEFPMTEENIETGSWVHSLGPDGWITLFQNNHHESIIAVKSGFDNRTYEEFEEICRTRYEGTHLKDVVVLFQKWKRALKQNRLRILARILNVFYPEQAAEDVILEDEVVLPSVTRPPVLEDEVFIQEQVERFPLTSKGTPAIPTHHKSPLNFEVKDLDIAKGMDLGTFSMEPPHSHILREGCYEDVIIDDIVERDSEIVRFSSCASYGRGERYYVFRGPFDDVVQYEEEGEKSNETTRSFIRPTQMNVLKDRYTDEEMKNWMNEHAIEVTWERKNITVPLLLQSRYREYTTKNKIKQTLKVLCSRISCYDSEGNVYPNDSGFGYLS